MQVDVVDAAIGDIFARSSSFSVKVDRLIKR